ncbi:MAG: Gfo/Idh/MocA family oxidoreductase [Bacteroidota bacterium]
MKRFALIGAAGYVAPRHMKAIKDTNNILLAALDKNDSVGIIDNYFPEADFFVEYERFDRHLEKLKREGTKLDYLSVCSPNYLHDAHIRFGLRYGMDVICEKPLVLNPWNVDALQAMSEETGQQIYNILQLRLHPSVIALRKKIARAPANKIFDVRLTYQTSRGKWYYTSWKGEAAKSGGIATNIGIHFFDILQWIFGAVQENIVHLHTHDRAAGFLHLEKARVQWFLSINAETLDTHLREKGTRTYRSIQIEGEEFEFSGGFEDLHTKSYEAILAGEGFGIEEASNAIKIAYDIRNQEPVGLKGDYHPLAELASSGHPFKRNNRNA